MSIFQKRVNFKPFEYPEILQFSDMINKTFWTHDEVEFTADLQDFKVNLKSHEQEAIKRCLLGIAQIEVAVKTFWGDIYKYFPKPEINIVGSTFAHNESIHSLAYAKLLEVLGYDKDFENILDIPIFKKKIELSEKSLSKDKSIIEKLLYFTIVIENSSLFSQFATILSFTRFKGYLKNTSNIISWTSVDENIHKETGIWFINKMREEKVSVIDLNEDFINETFLNQIRDYMKLEEEFIDWIFEKGELEFFTKENLLDFMKHRVDESLKAINLPTLFNVSNDRLQPMNWFNEEIYSNELDDFFAKRPTAYTKHDKSITSNDLF